MSCLNSSVEHKTSSVRNHICEQLKIKVFCYFKDASDADESSLIHCEKAKTLGSAVQIESGLCKNNTKDIKNLALTSLYIFPIFKIYEKNFKVFFFRDKIREKRDFIRLRCCIKQLSDGDFRHHAWETYILRDSVHRVPAWLEEIVVDYHSGDNFINSRFLRGI